MNNELGKENNIISEIYLYILFLLAIFFYLLVTKNYFAAYTLISFKTVLFYFGIFLIPSFLLSFFKSKLWAGAFILWFVASLVWGVFTGWVETLQLQIHYSYAMFAGALVLWLVNYLQHPLEIKDEMNSFLWDYIKFISITKEKVLSYVSKVYVEKSSRTETIIQKRNEISEELESWKEEDFATEEEVISRAPSKDEIEEGEDKEIEIEEDDNQEEQETENVIDKIFTFLIDKGYEAERIIPIIEDCSIKEEERRILVQTN